MRLATPLLLAGAAGLLAARPAWAQADAPAPPAAPWSLGVRAGTGLNTKADDSAGSLTAFSVGFTGSYHSARARASVQLGAWLEAEQVNPHRIGSTYNTVLVLPLLLRTGSPGNRVHFVVGGGPVVHLTEHPINELYPAHYRYRRTVGCLVTGLEARVAPLRRLETTVALTLRVPLGPTLSRSNYSTRIPGSYPDEVSTGWLGLTLNAYLHQKS